MMTINIEFNRAFDGVIYSKVSEKHRTVFRSFEVSIDDDFLDFRDIT